MKLPSRQWIWYHTLLHKREDHWTKDEKEWPPYMYWYKYDTDPWTKERKEMCQGSHDKTYDSLLCTKKRKRNMSWIIWENIWCSLLKCSLTMCNHRKKECVCRCFSLTHNDNVNSVHACLLHILSFLSEVFLLITIQPMWIANFQWRIYPMATKFCFMRHEPSLKIETHIIWWRQGNLLVCSILIYKVVFFCILYRSSIQCITFLILSIFQ